MFGGRKCNEDSSGRFSLYGLPFPPDPINVKTLVWGSENLCLFELFIPDESTRTVMNL